MSFLVIFYLLAFFGIYIFLPCCVLTTCICCIISACDDNGTKKDDGTYTRQRDIQRAKKRYKNALNEALLLLQNSNRGSINDTANNSDSADGATIGPMSGSYIADMNMKEKIKDDQTLTVNETFTAEFTLVFSLESNEEEFENGCYCIDGKRADKYGHTTVVEGHMAADGNMYLSEKYITCNSDRWVDNIRENDDQNSPPNVMNHNSILVGKIIVNDNNDPHRIAVSGGNGKVVTIHGTWITDHPDIHAGEVNMRFHSEENIPIASLASSTTTTITTGDSQVVAAEIVQD